MTEKQRTATPAFLDSSLASSLDRLSDVEFWALARQQATRTQHSSRHEEYLECKLARGSERCWLAMEALGQVVPPPHRFALLPSMPGWMIGLVAWRGNTVAVIDLSAYLAGSRHPLIEQPGEAVLLVTTPEGEEESLLGLLVPDIGMTADTVDAEIVARDYAIGNWLAPLPAEAVKGCFCEALVLDVRLLLTDIVQHIGMSAFDE